MHMEMRLTNRLRTSINTCRLTSSVNIACPCPPALVPYIPPDMCVVDGFNFESRKRAWLPPWSVTTYRGIGLRSTSSSCREQEAPHPTRSMIFRCDVRKISYLSILNWGRKKLLEILVTLLVLVTSLPPLSNRLAMEDQNVEESVEE